MAVAHLKNMRVSEHFVIIIGDVLQDMVYDLVFTLSSVLVLKYFTITNSSRLILLSYVSKLISLSQHFMPTCSVKLVLRVLRLLI